jgi:TonB family protein
MKTAILLLAAAAAFQLAPVQAARMPAAQQVMGLDLNACPKPVWPPAALAQRVSGQTIVEVQVGDQGMVTDARVATSSGRADLDEAAVAGIRRCVFHAVLATGQAPTGWLKTKFVWIPGGAKQSEAHNQALFDTTKSRADAGDAAAQNRLGAWYQNGTYGAADPVQAAHWYRLAAEQGDAVAQNNLGVLYSRGLGVARDPKQAAAWYAKAAAQGHGWAQANLALAYEFGTAGEMDHAKAQYWLTEAAEGGLLAAQIRLGLESMRRAASDDERAVAAAWFARAAGRDAPPGIYYLGRTFELGLGNAQDDAQAAALYRRALGRSDGRAEVALAILVDAGRATASAPDEAATLYRKAMQSRYPAAFYRYGLLLEQRGDDALAAAVFRQGAELGDCDAVVRYVQVRQAPTPPAGTPGVDWERRAQHCAARSGLPPQM